MNKGIGSLLVAFVFMLGAQSFGSHDKEYSLQCESDSAGGVRVQASEAGWLRIDGKISGTSTGILVEYGNAVVSFYGDTVEIAMVNLNVPCITGHQLIIDKGVPNWKFKLYRIHCTDVNTYQCSLIK